MKRYIIAAIVLVVLLVAAAILLGPCVLTTPTDAPSIPDPEPGVADSTG